MKSAASMLRLTAIALVAVQLVIQVAVPAAQARMIGTDMHLSAVQTAEDRLRLEGLLEREEVRRMLADQGISIEEARSRIAALTDAEVQQLSGQIDQLPAGGDGVGVVVAAILIIFLVLLITDIMGYTNVFPFVR